jgi:hypothetical protein
LLQIRRCKTEAPNIKRRGSQQPIRVFFSRRTYDICLILLRESPLFFITKKAKKVDLSQGGTFFIDAS